MTSPTLERPPQVAPAPDLRLSSAYYDGAWHSFDGDRQMELINPDTEERTGTLISPDAELVSAVVGAATDAQPAWSQSSTRQRLQLLRSIIALTEQHADDLAQLISEEIGAPIDFARAAQVGTAIKHLRATEKALATAPNDIALDGDPMHRVRYEPIGVAGLITPWNWPLNQVVLKVGAALAAGCTMVLKPSEYATRTAIAFTEIIHAAGVPKGVFNLLIGDKETGAQLAAHPDIDMISFTGSSAAGRKVSQAATDRLARTALELGGKSPNLLFEDCDVETSVRQGLAHCFRNAGQSCNAASRMLVARPIYDEVVALAAKIAQATPLGRPYHTGPHQGPLINRPQFDRVRAMIKASDARCVAGGAERPEGFSRGFYVRPTVFADVPPDDPLFQEEVFGPVLTITPFEDEDHAIALANDTRFGLAAYIQTADPARADRVASRLRAGMVQVNGTSRAEGAPFGGVKASGHGREGGLWGIRSLQEVKSISGAAQRG